MQHYRATYYYIIITSRLSMQVKKTFQPDILKIIIKIYADY